MKIALYTIIWAFLGIGFAAIGYWSAMPSVEEKACRQQCWGRDSRITETKIIEEYCYCKPHDVPVYFPLQWFDG